MTDSPAPRSPASTNGPAETNLETPTVSGLLSSKAQRFLNGPISMSAIQSAARLPGKALALYLATHHRCSLLGQKKVSLPRGFLGQLGIRKDAKARGLACLERAGLVRLEKCLGRPVKVELL